MVGVFHVHAARIKGRWRILGLYRSGNGLPFYFAAGVRGHGKRSAGSACDAIGGFDHRQWALGARGRAVGRGSGHWIDAATCVLQVKALEPNVTLCARDGALRLGGERRMPLKPSVTCLAGFPPSMIKPAARRRGRPTSWSRWAATMPAQPHRC